MRKIFLLLSILTLGSLTFADKNVVEIRGGYDLYSNTNLQDGKIINGDGPNYGNDISDELVETGYTLAVEYRREILDGFQIGGGLKYSNSKTKQPSDFSGFFLWEATEYDYENLTSIPLYFTARYNFKNSSEFTPYVKLNLGYSFNSSNLKETQHFLNANTGEIDGTYVGFDYDAEDGLYYGFGFGVEYKNFLVDLSYEINDYKYKGKYYTSAGMYNGAVKTEYQSDEIKSTNQKLNLSIGYQFEF